MDLSGIHQNSTDGNREDNSIDQQPRNRQYVVLQGDKLKIYDHEREVTDEDDYDRNEQQFIISRKEGVVQVNPKKMSFVL